MLGMNKHSKILPLAVVVAAMAVGLSCSSVPEGPQQGTPEWYMAGAEMNFGMGDYVKTVEQLKEATKAEGEMGRRAQLWRIVLTAGLARGYDRLVDAFVEGQEKNEARTEEYQPWINQYRRRTRINAIEFSEGVGKVKELMGDSESIALDIPLPPGDGAVSTVLQTVEAGNKVEEPKVLTMEDQTLTRGVLSVISEMTGGTEFSQLIADAEGDGIQAERDAMNFGIARILLDISVMFDREGLDDPRVRDFILNMTTQWAEPYMESDDLGERLEEFKFDLENERRDREGKRRIKKEDS